jgi:hypothetical protein
MSISGSDNRSNCNAARAVCFVLTLALLALSLTFPLGHTHAKASAGWYNTECPLAELTARAAFVSVLSVPPSVWTKQLPSETFQLAVSNVSAPLVFVVASRAPPLA